VCVCVYVRKRERQIEGKNRERLDVYVCLYGVYALAELRPRTLHCNHPRNRAITWFPTRYPVLP